jgi:hypothetical protein
MLISSCERESVRLSGELALRGPARAVKPRTYRPDRCLECRRDLLVAQVGERIEEQRVPLARAHRRESACQPHIETYAVDTSCRVVLVRRPAV